MPRRYYEIVHGDGGWLVRGDNNMPLFAGQTFGTPAEASAHLYELAKAKGIALKPDQNTIGLPGRYAASGDLATTPFSSPKGRDSVKLTVNLWPALDDLLDNMADELGTTKGGAIEKGLALLKVAIDAKREGKKLILLNEMTGEEEEITGI